MFGQLVKEIVINILKVDVLPNGTVIVSRCDNKYDDEDDNTVVAKWSIFS